MSRRRARTNNRLIGVRKIETRPGNLICTALYINRRSQTSSYKTTFKQELFPGDLAQRALRALQTAGVWMIQ